MEKKYSEENLFYNDLQIPLGLKNNENHNINKTLKAQIQFLNKYFKLYTIIKFIFGFIIITLPYILFLYLFYNKNLEGSNRLIIIGYFITMSLTGAIVILLIVFESGDSCKIYGFFFRPWELKYILRLINLFFIIIFSLFFFILLNHFIQIYL